MTPRQIGPYRLQAEIGRGGMGIVYKAYDDTLQRFVALKTLAGTVAGDPLIKERFAREARSMAMLNSPNVVGVYAIGERQEDSAAFFVMEYIDGEPLSAVLQRREPLDVADAARVVYNAARGLGAAHRRGIVHRDVKPGNILIGRDGSVKVTDFGIARLNTGSGAALALTQTGDFLGTPGYLSPELCNGGVADARSDVFSLGIVLFECLAGRVPFTADSPLGLMLHVVKAQIPDIRQINAKVDGRLHATLMHMLAKNPGDRPQNGDAVAQLLARIPGVAGETVGIHVRPARAKPLFDPTPTAPVANVGDIIRPSPFLDAAGKLLQRPSTSPGAFSGTDSTASSRSVAAAARTIGSGLGGIRWSLFPEERVNVRPGSTMRWLLRILGAVLAAGVVAAVAAGIVLH